MTDYRSLYDKDFIGAWDLTDDDMVITITRVQGGQLVGPGGRKSKKPIVYMRGTEKGFALNSTNGKTIAALYGNHVEKWVGKKLALYKSTTRNPNGDGDVECIRVRPKAPASFDEPARTGQVPPLPDSSASAERASAEQIDAIKKALAESGVERAAFLAKAEITDIAELSAADAPKAIEWIRSRKKVAA